MANTTHLELPLLAAAQAQKHVTHNEAVQRLDATVQLSVKDRHLTNPPGAPSDGDRYIVASGGSGDWASWDLNIAWYVDGVWTKLVPRGGWIAYLEDENLVLIHDGADWVKLPATTETWQVLAASAVAVSHTGDTSETTLASITVPGGAMGPNGILRVTTLWSFAGSGTKRARIVFGGEAYGHVDFTTATVYRDQRLIHNRNAENAQIGFTAASPPAVGGWGSHTGAPDSSTVDTSMDQNLVLSGTLIDNAGDTITLESYLVELLYRA
jgi:hypothetical protein